MDSEWAGKGYNISFVRKNFEHAYKVLVMAISKEKGLEGFFVLDKNPNSIEFCKIYDKISANGANFVVYGDNAGCHSSYYSKDFFRERGS
jgi:hypothetical protein